MLCECCLPAHLTPAYPLLRPTCRLKTGEKEHSEREASPPEHATVLTWMGVVGWAGSNRLPKVAFCPWWCVWKRKLT